MRENKRKWCLMLVLLSLFISIDRQAFASDLNGNTGTDIGVGFDKSNINKPNNPHLNPSKPQTIPPKINNQRLPQLGKFIEPMFIILFGLVIWLTVLSTLALKKYLNKESKI